MKIEDIFSKKKTKKEKQIEIAVDYREKNSLVASHLMSQGIKVKFQHLHVADYLLGNIAIERKSISDLKSSIINKRINSQLIELKQYSKPLLLVEGIDREDLYEGIINENALRGFLLSVALEYQVPIIFTQSEEDSARYIAILAKKKENQVPALRASKITLTEEQRLQYILEGFPRVGPITAKKLLKKFKKIKNIANAGEDELREILGKNEELFTYLLNYNVDLPEEKNKNKDRTTLD